MTMPNKVEIKDFGWRKIMQEMQTGKRTVLTVGIQGDEASLVHPRTGLSVGEYAMINEMGQGVPERSMIRTWVDQKVDRMKAELNRAYVRVLRAKMDKNVERAEMSRLGKKYVRQVQSRIERKRIPPVKNAPMTIRRKGFDHPLIETGQLKDSFTFKVEG